MEVIRMANKNNLVKNSGLTPSERSENARKAGIASGKARRERRDMKKSLEMLLGLSIKKGDIIDAENAEALTDVKGKNLTVQDAILVAQIQKALKGDLRAAEFLRDTAGQKPVDNKNIKQDVNFNNPFSGLTTEELKKLIDDE